MKFADPLSIVIDRLISEGKQVGPRDPQSKALACQVIFKSGYRAQGALSSTPEGTLRLLAPGLAEGSDGKPQSVLAEHFFDCASVESVVVLHSTESQIVGPGRA